MSKKGQTTTKTVKTVKTTKKQVFNPEDTQVFQNTFNFYIINNNKNK